MNVLPRRRVVGDNGDEVREPRWRRGGRNPRLIISDA